jgi:hypothetical protein
MPTSDIQIQVNVKSDLEARQVKQALESIAKTFKPAELALIAKKVEMPLVQMKIRSML